MLISNLSNQRILVCVLGVLFLGLSAESVRVLRSGTSVGAQTTETTAMVVPYTVVLQEFHLQRDGTPSLVLGTHMRYAATAPGRVR